MSGHSKWSTIKRKKAAEDAKRGKIFTKLAREIAVAARKKGGGDPEINFALRLAIDRAKDANMPKENIERAIRRGTGEDKDAAAIEEVYYEGYAPNGVALMIECATDNRNRTVADLRHILNEHGGSLGEDGSVAWQFSQKSFLFSPPRATAKTSYLNWLSWVGLTMLALTTAVPKSSAKLRPSRKSTINWKRLISNLRRGYTYGARSIRRLGRLRYTQGNAAY